MAKQKHKYDVYYTITVDGEARDVKLIGGWESDKTDVFDVAQEVDSDPDLIGEDFEGYPEDAEDHEIVWEGFPTIVKK